MKRNSRFGIIIVILLGMTVVNPFPLFAQNIKALFQEAETALANSDYPKAIDLFGKIIEMEPNFAPAYNGLAMAYRENKSDMNEVIWLLKTATDIDPNYAQAYDNLAKAYYNVGNFDKAEDYSLKALSINPDLVSSQLSLAWIYLLGKSQPDKAIPYFKQVVVKNKIPMALYGLGIAYCQNGEQPMAMESVTELRGLGKEDLAGQLETMMRARSSAGHQANPALAQAAGMPPPGASSPAQNNAPASPAAPAPAKTNDNKKSIMKVRLRGKIVPTGSEPSAPSGNPEQDAAARLEHIKSLRSGGSAY